MNIGIQYRGKIATSEDVAQIEAMMSANPQMGRTRLSQELCILWNWKQSNGALRDMVCRGFLLELEKAGFIQLPPRQKKTVNPFLNRKKPKKISIDQTEIIGTLKTINSFEVTQVRRTQSEKLFNSLLEQYHYLGYTQPVGEHLKYLISYKGRPISCFAFSSSPRHIGSRDKYIGWSPAIRKTNIHLIAYNTRFLIVPWVHIRYLASHLLGLIGRQISTDWNSLYNHPLYFLETFVDTELYKGTCYKAANWQYLGKTTGRGKNDKTHKVNRSIKLVFGYALTKDFRKVLCSDDN